MTSSSSPNPSFDGAAGPPLWDAPDREQVELARIGEMLFRRRWTVVGTAALSVLLSGAYVFTAVPIFSSTAMVLIEKEEKGRPLGEAPVSESKADDYYQTQYRLLKSRSLLKKVHELLELEKIPEFAGGGPGALAAAVQIAPIPRSRLVNVSAESRDPELAARIANTLSEVYVAQNLENKLFISKEILQALQSEPTAAEDLEERFHSLPAVVNNGLIQELKGRFAALEARWGDLSGRYTDEHPERIRLRSEMAALRARIREETGRAVKGMKAELSGHLLGNNVRIVDRAEPPSLPSRPKKRQYLSMALIGGLLAGCMLGFALENLDQTIHTQEDIETKLKMPFLGALSRSAAFKGDFAREYEQLLTGPESFTSESLKNIRTMLGFAMARRPMKRLLITSTIQGEGKTFLSINLAMVFAQLGKRVLLLEGDLRRPNLHRRFGLPKENGLSQFLAHGQDTAELAGLVRETGVKNLSVLHCGAVPPNPAELLSTPRLGAVLDWAGQEYDQVLIDGTPVFPVTDALLWTRLVDGAVFVVQFAGVHSGLSQKACQKLREGGMSILGAVLNQVTWRAGAYGDYYYNYYYQYYAGDEKKA